MTHWFRRFILGIVSGLLIATSLVIQGMAQEAIEGSAIEKSQTMQLDVIELLAGRQVDGSPTHSVDYQGFRYLFGTPENKAAFEKEPAKFAVQLDGGCGRMGSLSGLGNTRLYTVHNQQLFVFASEGCRNGFLSNPDALIERDDPVPELTPGQEKLGRQALERIVRVMGGAEKIDAVQNYREQFKEQVKRSSQSYDHRTDVLVDFSGRIRQADQWDDILYLKVLNGDNSYFAADIVYRPMYSAGQRELRRQFNRDLLTILKARNRDDFHVGLVKADEPDAETIRLIVSFDGTTTELTVARQLSLVQVISYRGRGPNSQFGRTSRVLSEYRHVGGILLPHRYHQVFEGATIPNSARKVELAINVETKTADFQMPQQ